MLKMFEILNTLYQYEMMIDTDIILVRYDFSGQKKKKLATVSYCYYLILTTQN